jgi:polyisoprenoid-binding protein YceI
MKKSFLLLAFLFSVLFVFSQEKHFTKTGIIVFDSDAPLEKIRAENTRVASVFDVSTGQIEFSLLIRSFEFKKALMQEHFNEEYMESDKFPKAIFKGNIEDISKVNFSKDGEYTVKVVGNLTMHGETNPVETTATFKVLKGKVSAKSSLDVKLTDYKVKVPSMMSKNIAETIEINVTIPEYELLKK